MADRRAITMIDVLMLSMPRIAPVRPAAALGVLKSICNKANKSSKTFDINADFFLNFASDHAVAAKAVDDYFISSSAKLSNDDYEKYDIWLQSWVDKIVKENSNTLVVSVFSWQSQVSVRDLLSRLRPKYNGTIVVGGQGLTNSQNLSAHWADRAEYAEELFQNKLINFWIKGEAEETFYKFLIGEREFAGLNTHGVVMLEDANNIPLSDFSDLDIASYRSGYEADGGVLPIESCRGCVRSCVFCEMSSEHGGLRRRDGHALAKELFHYYETYGVKHYYFHDDLMNSSMPDFKDFINDILSYYEENNLPDKFFSLSGYWIIRNPRQFGAKDFELFAKAGGNLLVTGIETGSDRLRKTLRKGFTNKDLEFNLEQMHKNKIKFYFMLIAGLPGETTDDFQDTIDSLTRWQKYVANGTVIGINLGTTATLEPGTEIYNNAEKFNIVPLKGKERAHGIYWMCTTTPDLNYKERVRRRIAVQEHVLDLGYPIWKGDDHLKIIIDKYKQDIEVWNASTN